MSIRVDRSSLRTASQAFRYFNICADKLGAEHIMPSVLKPPYKVHTTDLRLVISILDVVTKNSPVSTQSIKLLSSHLFAIGVLA